VVVEGPVISKRTYSPGGGVQNDIALRVTGVLKGSGVSAGDTILIHVPGGYAGSDHTCWQDTISDGARVEVGTTYLVLLTKEAETKYYRGVGLASFFRISHTGSVIPLTPALVRNHVFSGQKIADFEARAKALP
jgi:hypothetical protein